MGISLQETLASLLPEWPQDLLPAIRDNLRKSQTSIVVLDDDPTGTQTVYDVPVLTDWAEESLRAELESGTSLFYILTNSRSLSETPARELASEVGQNLRQASRKTGRPFVAISRSDSTLRGHFPAEVDALAEALGENDAIRVIIPFFLEGGRYTIGDTHYVREGDVLVPAADTAFAQDAVFGYTHSNLCEWVEEKTRGRIAASSVISLTLEDIREGGPGRVTEKVAQCPTGGVCVVNAASYRDLEVATLGMIDAEQRGRRFLYRTAASFVRIRAGLAPRPLIERHQLELPKTGGGLVVVGSYVPRSSQQLSHLLEHSRVMSIEVHVDSLLADEKRTREIERVAAEAQHALASGRDVVIHTSRELLTGRSPDHNLSIGGQISQGLVKIVSNISARPRYLLAKGGITSSDLATQALQVKRAWVVGQILPGVPVWRLGPESRWPGLVYIVFPGNVGASDAITSVVNVLK